MTGRLFAAEFEPVAQLGDVVLLLGTTAFASADGSNAFEVVAIEAIPLLGQHGAVVIWTQAGAIPATFGYALDQAAATGTINANLGIASTQQISALKNAATDVTQLRFITKAFGTLPGGWAVDDFDVKVKLPGSTRRWSLANADGVINALNQVALPQDVAVLPAQGANATVPGAFPSENIWAHARRTELFVYKDAAPSFDIVNTGSAAMSTAMGVALMISGYRFSLRPISDATLVEQQVLGMTVNVPNWISPTDLHGRIPILPVSGRG